MHMIFPSLPTFETLTAKSVGNQRSIMCAAACPLMMFATEILLVGIDLLLVDVSVVFETDTNKWVKRGIMIPVD